MWVISLKTSWYRWRSFKTEQKNNHKNDDADWYSAVLRQLEARHEIKNKTTTEPTSRSGRTPQTKSKEAYESFL